MRSRSEAMYLHFAKYDFENEAKAGIELQMMAMSASIILGLINWMLRESYEQVVETHVLRKRIAEYH